MNHNTVTSTESATGRVCLTAAAILAGVAVALSLNGCGGSSPASAFASAGQPAAGPTAAPTTPTTLAGDPVHGKVVYETFCIACHQADGTGMNGVLAANFIADKTRLAKTDEQLLTSIRDGLTGKVGTMPPWGPTLSEQERKDALAYIRKTFGGK